MRPLEGDGNTPLQRDTVDTPDILTVLDGGLYVHGTACGVAGIFLIDTGSAITLMSQTFYNRLPSEQRPSIKPTNMTAHGVTGGGLVIYGEVTMKISVSGKKLPYTFYVCDITQDVILGIDFLDKYRCTWDWDNQILEIKGDVVVPMSTTAHPSPDRMVKLMNDVHLGPGEEIVTMGSVSNLGNRVASSIGILTPVVKFTVKYGVALASVLVDCTPNEVPVRLLNVNLKSGIQLRKGTLVAHFSPIERVLTNAVPGSAVTVANVKGEAPSHVVPPHLLDLHKTTCEGLTPEQQQKVTKLLIKWQDIFAKDKLELGRTHLAEHSIDTGTTPPIKQRVRRVPIHKQDVEAKLVQDMIDQGVIERSNSPWASPIVLVKKHDGSIRYCIDYRQLNKATVKDSHPLPRIDESLDALGGSSWFSTLDLQSGYWQVAMKKSDKPKTAFVTRSGLFEFNVLPFGLCNAPATFQRLMEQVLRGIQWKDALLYIDDIIVHGCTFDLALLHLEEVFVRLRDAGLKLKPKKCELFKKEVIFLGYKVTPEGTTTDPAKVEKIKKWPAPTNLRELQSFLGIASYYRKFIKNFAKVAEPLHCLLRKTVAFEWTAECNEAFEFLKQCLINAPILAYPKMEGTFILDTDASNAGIGAVLSQIQDGTEKVIAYASRSLSRPERNYCVTRRELLAIVHFTHYFRHFLYGGKFIVRTDHGSLRWLYNFKEPEGQVARWLERLGCFDFEVEHRAGLKHSNADALSRYPCSQCGRTDEPIFGTSNTVGGSYQISLPSTTVCGDPGPQSGDSDSSTPSWMGEGFEEKPYASGKLAFVNALRRGRRRQKPNPDLSGDDLERTLQSLQNEADDWSCPKIREIQEADPAIGLILRWKESKIPRPKWKEVSDQTTELKFWWARWDSLEVVNNILCMKWEQVGSTGNTSYYRLVTPSTLVPKVLDLFHNRKEMGHFGFGRTWKRVHYSKFFWPKMRISVANWCKQCDVCAARKPPPKHYRRSALRQYAVGAPLERVALDVAGPFPMTDGGNRFILVIIDYFTRWAEAYPIIDHTAKTIANIFAHQFVARWGPPKELHTDQGREFESKIFAELCNLTDVYKTRTTPFRPCSNGLVERYNRTIKDVISHFVSVDQRDWDQYVPWATMAYNTSQHSSTGQTPYYMMFGREMEYPLTLLFEDPNAPYKKVPPDIYIQELHGRLQQAFDLARTRTRGALKRQKRQYDRRLCGNPYLVGTMVWLLMQHRTPGLTPKLQSHWSGPWIITRRLNDVTYQILKHGSPKSKPKIVHSDKLKLYEGPKTCDYKQYGDTGMQEGDIRPFDTSSDTAGSDSDEHRQESSGSHYDGSASECDAPDPPVTAKRLKVRTKRKGLMIAPNPNVNGNDLEGDRPKRIRKPPSRYVPS